MSLALHNFHDLKHFALLDTKPTFNAFRDEGSMHLHPKIMFILGYKCIDFSLYTNFPNLMSYLWSLG